MFSEFIHTGINPADHFTGRIVLADGKALLALDRHCSKLLFKYLTGDTWHRLIRITTLALAVGTLDFLAICLSEECTERLVVVTKGQVVHSEALVG